MMTILISVPEIEITDCFPSFALNHATLYTPTCLSLSWGV